ncbi:hypothetical protein OAD68_00285 [Candidatus Pelagibacter sp.]|nr:hypothetical protein [Candidatus Pelagibacter sp.]
MIKNKLNIIFTTIVLIIILFITYFTFDSRLRRYAYEKSIGVYKLYQSNIIRSHIYYRDFNSASEQILQYIEFTQKISKGKNSMLQEIIDVTELVTSKTYTQDEFNEMERVYIKINEITDDIYKNHIWLARSFSDDSPSQSIKHLNKALRLSKSSEETYREIIRLFSKDKKLINLMSNYCMNYFNNFGGGAVDRMGANDEKNFFMGSNSIFAISRDENYSELNQRFINNMNEYYIYNFIFKKGKNINEFNILKSFLSGSKVSIRNIVLHNDKKNEIYVDDLIIQSLSSYILSQSNKEIVFLNASDEDDILKFNLKRKYNDINQITLELKLERLPIVNKAVCGNLDEN